MSNTIIPSSQSDRTKIKTMIEEISYIMYDIQMKNENKKDIIEDIKEKYGISPKEINKLATITFKNNFADIQAEQEEFNSLYESIMKTSNDTTP